MILGPPPDAFQAYISESSVPCVLAMYYTLQVTYIEFIIHLLLLFIFIHFDNFPGGEK